MVSSAWHKLIDERGKLTVLELYPLIVAEKFAVPYPPESLVRIFRNLGLTASYQLVPVRDILTYCVVAQRATGRQLRADTGNVRQVVEQEWALLLQDAIENYAMTHRIDNYQGYRDVTQHLTTIASICAWRAGKWVEGP